MLNFSTLAVLLQLNRLGHYKLQLMLARLIDLHNKGIGGFGSNFVTLYDDSKSDTEQDEDENRQSIIDTAEQVGEISSIEEEGIKKEE